jgi:hypothetical protein
VQHLSTLTIVRRHITDLDPPAPTRPKMQALPPQPKDEPTSDAAREQEAMKLYRNGHFKDALVLASYIGNPSHQKRVMKQIGLY